MNNKDINAILAELAGLNWRIEAAFDENGGEITDELQAQLDQVDNLKALLEGEGIDSLGRWLKGVEDRIKALKAERDAINRKIKADTNLVDYIKGQIRQVLDILGEEKVKGTCYGFRKYDASRAKIDNERIDRDWQEIVTKAAREVGLPECFDVEVDTTVTKLSDWADEHDGECREYFLDVPSTPTVIFSKPKTPKEQDLDF